MTATRCVTVWTGVRRPAVHRMLAADLADEQTSASDTSGSQLSHHRPAVPAGQPSTMGRARVASRPVSAGNPFSDIYRADCPTGSQDTRSRPPWGHADDAVTAGHGQNIGGRSTGQRDTSNFGRRLAALPGKCRKGACRSLDATRPPRASRLLPGCLPGSTNLSSSTSQRNRRWSTAFRGKHMHPITRPFSFRFQSPVPTRTGSLPNCSGHGLACW